MINIKRLIRIEKILSPKKTAGVAIINKINRNVTYNGVKMSMEEYENVKCCDDIQILMNIPRPQEG